MANAKSTEPTGWQPIEVGTNRNGHHQPPIEVTIVTADVGGTEPAPSPTPKAATPATSKES